MASRGTLILTAQVSPLAPPLRTAAPPTTPPNAELLGAPGPRQLQTSHLGPLLQFPRPPGAGLTYRG